MKLICVALAQTFTSHLFVSRGEEINLAFLLWLCEFAVSYSVNIHYGIVNQMHTV